MRRVAPLVLCVLVLGACAGDDDSERSPASSGGAATTSAESAEATLASAVDRVQSETARFELDASIASAGGSVDVTGEGTVDFEADRSRTTLDMSELLALGGQGSPADWRGEAINIGDVIYMRLPGLTKALPQEVEWLKVDAGTLAEQGGTQFNAPDPGQFVTFATAMAEGADEVGSEEIRGSDTTHYRGTVDVEDIVAAAPPQDRARLQSYARRLRTGGLESFPLDVWIDDEGLIRRMRSQYDGVRSAGSEFSLVTSVDFFEFGVEANIEPPPRSDVTAFEDVIGRGAEETQHSEPEGS